MTCNERAAQNGMATPARARRHHIDRRAASILQSQSPAFEQNGDQAGNTHWAADLLGLSPKTLELMRHQGCGPKYIRLSPRTIRYLKSDIFAWLRERAANTSPRT